MPKVCDFCGGPEPIWKYSSTVQIAAYNGVPFHVPNLTWLACDVCSAMVETNDRPGLMARGVGGLTTPIATEPFIDKREMDLRRRFIVEGVLNVFWQGWDGESRELLAGMIIE